jgi:hypothetical protein
VPERVLVPAVPELERELVRVAAEPEHGQAGVALGLGQAGVALGLGQAGVALELNQVAVELALVPVVELELVPVVAVPELGHPRGRLAVAPRTKSVTAARRRDLARLLAGEEDLAAVAETTREPAATEAAVAWAAAVTAVAVAPE